MSAYDREAARIRAPLAQASDIREAVRYATLAANSHNSQPWRFTAGENGAVMLPDLDRRLPAVDPDDHHLYASLGCAAENFALAAAALGRPADVRFEDDGAGRVAFDLGRAEPVATELFRAIPERQSTRSEYDGRAVASEDLRRLEAAARIEGIDVVFVTDDAGRQRATEFVVEGNTAQMDDPAFREELQAWIRFNPAAALAAGDGLFAGCTGNPSIPTWLARVVFPFVFTKGAENDKCARQLRSSAGIAVFIGARNDRRHWVDAGRAYQRFALQATALGIRNALVNQPVEVVSVREPFADWLGIGDRRPDLVARFGYAPALPMSLRRPIEAVLTA